MGCCAERKLLQENAEPLEPVSNEFLLEACARSSDHLAKHIVDLHLQGAWKEVASYVKQEDTLTYFEEYPHSKHTGWPSTAAELAMLCLIKTSQANSSLAIRITECFAQDFLALLQEASPALTLAILYLLNLALSAAARDGNMSLRKQLVAVDVFAVVVPFYSSDTLKLRSLASHVCSLVYWKHEEWQQKFIQQGGHQALAQLIARDADDEHLGLDLFGDLLDLVCVREYAG